MSVFFKAYFLISFFIIAVPVEATQSLNMDLTTMEIKSLITESERRRRRRSSRFKNLEKMTDSPFSKEYLTEVYSIVTINMELSRRYFYGIGVPQNRSEFVAYKIAADRVADHYFGKDSSTSSSKNKIEEVVTKEMQEMISSIKQSQNIGKYYASMMFLKGIGTESFSSEGLYYLENLADRGYKPAQILLAKIFFSGLYEIKKNNKEALNWAEMAFEGENFDEATALKKAVAIDVEKLLFKSATSASQSAKVASIDVEKLLFESATLVSKRAKINPFKERMFLTAKKVIAKVVERRASKAAKRQALKVEERRASKAAKRQASKVAKLAARRALKVEERRASKVAVATERRALKAVERRASKKVKIALQNGQCRKVFTRK